MLKGAFSGRYNTDDTSSAAAGTLEVTAGDFNLRASLTDATFVSGPTLSDLSLSVEKPGSFIVEYNVPKQDFRFQFMNSVKVLDKPLNLIYKHAVAYNLTVVDGTLIMNSANKLSANFALNSGALKLRYTYEHGGKTTFEPSYDLGMKSWDIAVSRRISDDDKVKALYQNSSKLLGLEWWRNGAYKCFMYSGYLHHSIWQEGRECQG